jgi:SAM-dependent methyltransferase
MQAKGDISMRAQEISARHWDARATSEPVPQWISNRTITEALYRRMTGGKPKFWLAWVLEDYFTRRFDRVLSIGCGAGDHEILLARQAHVGHVDAFDVSSESIRIAREKAAAEGLSRKTNFFVSDFENFEQQLGPDPYDLVCFIGSLHHVRELESMLGFVASHLAVDGRLLFNEYTGDCYTILEDRKVAVINRLLDCIDPDFLNPARPRYVNPTLDQMLAGDPSEAVRASLILPFLRHRFEIELLQPYGGAVMHCLYPSLNHAKLCDGSPESTSILRLLIEFERILYEEAKYLPSDFHLGICRAAS